jgi:uncharacterized protein (UPF0335 family)
MNLSKTAQDELKAFYDRLDSLEENLQNVREDMREVYEEAKSKGFDAKIMRRVQRLKKKSKADRETEDTMTEIYGEPVGL